MTSGITTAEELFTEIDLYFLDPAKAPYYKSQARAGKQVEGWFKAELNHFLSSLSEGGRLSGWVGEVTVSGKKKCDYVVTLGLQKIYIEIKALYWSEQPNNWNWAYFDPKPSKPGKPDKGYIADDARKLSAISDGQCSCLLFVYPRPDLPDWQQRVNTFIDKMWSIDKIRIRESASIPNTAYTEFLYVAKLEVVPNSTKAGFMATTRAELIASLEQKGPALQRLTAGLADDALDFHAGPGEWSIREILAHLVDDEMYVMRLRMERIIKEDHPHLTPHDEQKWYASRNSTRDRLDELLADFSLQRAASLGIIKMLREEDWARQGIQPEYGTFTAEGWLRSWVEHDTVHLRQIESALQTYKAKTSMS